MRTPLPLPRLATSALTAALLATAPLAAHATAAPSLAQAMGALDAQPASAFVGQPGRRVRDAAEFERMKAYLRRHYDGVVARHQFELEPGRTVDCIDALTQPGARRQGLSRLTPAQWQGQALPSAMPPSAPAASTGAGDRNTRDPGVFLWPARGPGAVPEHDGDGRDRSCPDGTVPKLRLGLEQLTAFETLAHFRHKWGEPAGQQALGAAPHEYADAYQSITNYGAESYLNVWKTYTEKTSEFSLSQIWVTGGSPVETVEAGWQVYRHRHLLNPKYPYFFIYSTQDGYNKTGCYDLECDDFVQTNKDVVIGGRWTNLSEVDGPQYSTAVKARLDDGSDGAACGWWIAVDGVWAGYYPCSLYDSGGIRNAASFIDFGGEIVNTSPHGRHTMTDMGSGYKPSAGFGRAAYQRTIRYITMVDGQATFATPSLTERRTGAGCYDIDAFYADGDWKTYFYFGGEGYDTGVCP
ncbi:MAG: neprosin family prolyl endopeptidase [Burkholderiaceae bacterium]